MEQVLTTTTIGPERLEGKASEKPESKGFFKSVGQFFKELKEELDRPLTEEEKKDLQNSMLNNPFYGYNYPLGQGGWPLY